MRLLNVDTRKLQEFHGPECPPYAILSHTWGDDEVLFSDISSSAGRGVAKPAYSKIEYTCRQAASQKLKYCWIDTCCIDKTSSAELSEAINSMFSWYRDATVCYAYLEDVRSSSVDTDLPNARWFTRGWTLQELLAPRRVEFYGRNWESLGFKDTESEHITEFTHKLASITEIDELVLWKPDYMRCKSVAARMSWASKRSTRRLEDTAYCLLGIFGVNMPLLYGEGDRAFVRLQEEIIRISADHSIFAWDRDLGETNTVSCLASSPSWFRRGAYVVPFGRNKSQTKTYTITNQGLQIELPLFRKPQTGIVYGLINCHWENTLLGCIGIPLRGALDSTLFDRSSRHPPETISSSEMSLAKSRTIFLSIRPPIEIPFAAEVNLQVYDRSLKPHGFLDLEIINNPMASHHWHPRYESFRLRWLSRSQAAKVEVIGLWWSHSSQPKSGVAICIRGKIDGSGNDGIGRFRALDIAISFRVEESELSVEDYILNFGKDGDDRRAGGNSSMTASCTVNSENSSGSGGIPLEITAQLRQEDIFGNDVYTLAMNTRKN